MTSGSSAITSQASLISRMSPATSSTISGSLLTFASSKRPHHVGVQRVEVGGHAFVSFVIQADLQTR